MSRKNEEKAKLAEVAERLTDLVGYAEFLRRPWRFFLLNFWMGLIRGFGFAVGMTIIVALAAYLLGRIITELVAIPVIGQYVTQLVEFVQEQLKHAPKIR